MRHGCALVCMRRGPAALHARKKDACKDKSHWCTDGCSRVLACRYAIVRATSRDKAAVTVCRDLIDQLMGQVGRAARMRAKPAEAATSRVSRQLCKPPSRRARMQNHAGLRRGPVARLPRARLRKAQG